MDDKKKFEIEFDDDFDSWLTQHEQATKDLKSAAQPSAPADIPMQRRPMQGVPAQPAADIPMQRRPMQGVPAQPAADIPMQRRPMQGTPAQPAAGIPMQHRPMQGAPAQPAAGIPMQRRPMQGTPAQPAAGIPMQHRPMQGTPAQPAAGIPMQRRPMQGTPAQPAADIPMQHRTMQGTPAQPAADIPMQRRPMQGTPAQPAADIPMQRRPMQGAPVQSAPVTSAQSKPATSEKFISAAPVQSKPATSEKFISAAPVQSKPATSEKFISAAPVQSKPATSEKFTSAATVQSKPVTSEKFISAASEKVTPAATEKSESEAPVIETAAKSESAENSQLKPDSNKFKPIESNSGNDISSSRGEIVKNFKVEITEEDFNKPAYEEPEQPVKRDKSVYFAGRKPAKAQTYSRNAQQRALMMEEKKKRAQRILSEQRRLENKQMDRIRGFLVFLVIVVSSALLSIYGISCMNDVLALDRSNELVMVNIEKGAGYEEIIDTLGDNGLIKHEWFCKLICKFRGFDKKTYLNGMHYLTADMGVEGMLTEMLANQSSDKTIRLSFPEGWSLPQIINKLDENNVCPAEYIYAALEEVEFDYSFVNSIPEDGSRSFSLEGYLFPDTYDFFVSEKQGGIGENPTSIINKLLGNFESRWSEVYTKRAKELGLTMDEVIIIASIIQKEAADKSQMGVVSSVIHNRLNNASLMPLLECNSTKDYVTNYLVPALGDANASQYLATYDTYNSNGLPPGPICNPGVDAIEAALNPDDTDYFYFCHNEEGKIYTAKTYDQHQKNWALVLKDNEAN